MKLVDRYIAKTVLAAIGLVTLMLTGLQLFILLVNQLDDLGRGDFGILQAGLFVLLQAPYQVYLFFPMASLLGCLIGLGTMANNHELVVMRSAGMSIAQVTMAVFKAAMVIIVIVTVAGETLVPRLAYFANDKKMQALNGGQTLRTAHGVWLRHQNDFITIGTVLPNNLLQDVYQFRFDHSRHLQLARHMAQINYENGLWRAYDATETVFSADKTKTNHSATMDWDIAINPNRLKVSSSEPDEMTLHELRQYLRAQKASRQATLNYQLAYWQRLIQPLTTLVMMILAIPFIFGPLRSSTMGSKLVAGIIAGFGFHLVNRFFGPVTQVLQWPPEIAAFGPTLVFAFMGLYLMRRAR